MKKLNIIITGAGSGIGEATAISSAKNGHKVFLVGRKKDKLLEVVKKIEGSSSSGSGIFSICDVSRNDQVKNSFNEAMEYFNGKVDVLFANAGVGYFGNVEDLTEEEFDAQFNTNVKGVFLWLRHTLPVFKKQNSGQIIVTSSNLGFKTAARCSLYAGTKFAVQAMVGALREELKGTSIKSGTINPGSVDTPWFNGKNVDRNKMLHVQDVVNAFELFINQSETSNIEHILLTPGIT